MEKIEFEVQMDYLCGPVGKQSWQWVPAQGRTRYNTQSEAVAEMNALDHARPPTGQFCRGYRVVRIKTVFATEVVHP